MSAGVREPSSDREFNMSENSHGSANTQAFGQSAEDFTHATGRRFETVQDRAVADAELPGTRVRGRCGPAGLAFETRSADIFLPTVAAMADKGVDLVTLAPHCVRPSAGVGDAVVKAFRVWTGKSRCRDLFPAATRAFDLGIRLRRGRRWREAWLESDTSHWTVVGGAGFEWPWRWLGIGMGTRSGWG